MTVALQAIPQFFDNAGNPLSGGKIFSYQAGTLIPLSTYTDRGGLTPNANPVVLDAAGRADVWLTANVAYKLIVQDAAGTVMDSVDQFYAGADPSQLVAAGIVPATGGTYTGAVSFAGGATFDGTAAQDLATLDSLGIAAVQNANLWDNSDFSIAQRILGSYADGTYGFDRVVGLCDTGSLTISQLAQPEDGTPSAGRFLQPDASAKRIGICEIVEAKNCLAYRGKNLVFSTRLRTSAATTVRVALVAWTGTADAPTRDVVNNWSSTTYTAGNFFVVNTSTIAVGATALAANTWTDVTISSTSAGGVVAPSTMNNLYMVVWTDTTIAQNATLDASRMRCGQGTTAPVWTPPHAQTELAKCQRQLYTFTAAGGGGTVWGWGISVGGTTVGSFCVYLPSNMRATPAINSVGAGTVQIFSTTTSAAGPITAIALSGNLLSFNCTSASANTAGALAGYLVPANMILIVSAEL